MENCVYLRTVVTLPPSSYSLKPHLRFFHGMPRKVESSPFLCLRRRPLMVKASAGRSHCEFSSLNSPLEPRSLVGKSLSGVFQNHPQLFHVFAKEELRLLNYDRDSAVARMLLSQESDEALLHRRIAQVKENECKIAIEDIMYLLILYKFSEIRVHLVPKLSDCLYNGRLEILPSKDWDLESIHSIEVLDIVREHVSNLTGLKANSSVSETWATTRIRKNWLARAYIASLLYGYFLKSVSLRYRLERCLSLPTHDLAHGHSIGPSMQHMYPYGSKDDMFGRRRDMRSIWQGLMRQGEEIEDLKCYVTSFHPGSLQRCAKLRSQEAVHLVESHSQALFGDAESGFSVYDEVIVTSFSSLRRLVLEAVAFGSFLWETEDYIDSVYKLKDHELV